MARHNKWQTKKQMIQEVESFFDDWHDQKKFVNAESLECLALRDFRDLFKTIKNNPIIKNDEELKSLCSSNSSGKLEIQ